MSAGCEVELPDHHYEVVSEDFVTYRGSPWGDNPEPDERGCCATVVVARTRREARQKACKTPEFAPWLDECMDNERVPFARLTVTDTVCHHGFCSPCHDYEWCPSCEAEWEFAQAVCPLFTVDPDAPKRPESDQ